MTADGERSAGWWRRQPLRTRLIVGLVVLVIVVLAAAALTMTFAVRSYLTQQLDRELQRTASELTAMPTFNPTGLRDGTIITEARPDGTWVRTPVLIGHPGDADSDDEGLGDDLNHGHDGTHELDDSDVGPLATPSSEPRTVELPSLGSYRVVSVTDEAGNVLTIGLPTEQVTETLARVLLIAGLTLAAAALVVAVGGGWLIRRELLPLARVAQTARHVASLPLSTGNPRLDERVPDLTPGTEVGDLTVALNEMLDHVDNSFEQRAETERQLRQFVADASHELRTPLASIRGYAELFTRPDADPDARKRSMIRIQAEAVRMGVLVDDLLLLARLDQGRPLLHDSIDLCRLAAEACSDIAVTAAADHPISIQLPDHPVVVSGDGGRLRQVLTNLLANAIQHTPAGTPVEVTVQEAADHVLLSVSDHGPGIPADFQVHAFERFTRSDESRARKFGGSGLGLSIVAAVVEAHGGSVRLNSDAKGTRVEVTLPSAS